MTTRDHRQSAKTLELPRDNLLLFAVGAAAALAATALLMNTAGSSALFRVFEHIDPIWLALCFGSQLLAYLGYVLALRDVARVDDGPRLSFSLTTRTVVAGFGVFAATHASGGFRVDYWALRRSGLGKDAAIARVLGLGALEYAVLAPAALVSAIVLLLGDGGSHVQDAMTLPWLLVIPGFAVALWVSAPERAWRLCGDKGSRGRFRTTLAHTIGGITTLRSLAARPQRHGLGLVGVSLYWLGDIACLWAALQVFGVELPIPALIVAYATGYLLTRRSLPVGGAGIVEVLMTFALVWVGLGLAPALLAVVVYRVFNFWLAILPATAVLPSVQELRRSYDQAGD
jgi:uncharacterized membrane protein YbhN (UPF0104 family)